ncbi:uncharacterized protein LOC135215155 isoform X2 [Macrobrachium nipponense]|uniref:uncharacterized protein LOC135215155 isoform X2 n=1 Tax=Macrobrachium nipponense TaxID=159736 RepID=UPI0030C7AAB0
MDSYQRYQLEILPVENECYECSDDDRPTLPVEVLEAVDQGNSTVIQDYLSRDGNVNALQEDESLLSRACALGKVEIVKMLLQCPDVHLNVKFEGATPLSRAARNGHVECVRRSSTLLWPAASNWTAPGKPSASASRHNPSCTLGQPPTSSGGRPAKATGTSSACSWTPTTTSSRRTSTL